MPPGDDDGGLGDGSGSSLDGGPAGLLSGGALGVGGSVVGSSLVGSLDGVAGGLVSVGVLLGLTAAPWFVSRSNLDVSPITPKVYAAQIWAGKPPPLTRPPPAAPCSVTWLNSLTL